MAAQSSSIPPQPSSGPCHRLAGLTVAASAKAPAYQTLADGGDGVLTKWSFLGPFVIGKNELDGDPLQGEPGGPAQVARDCEYPGRSAFYSSAGNQQSIVVVSRGKVQVVISSGRGHRVGVGGRGLRGCLVRAQRTSPTPAHPTQPPTARSPRYIV